jgi:uncharacterized membrane-anchored protein
MQNDNKTFAQRAATKVPELIFSFWVIKIAATTLGETGGDWVTMSLDLGYLAGTGVFAVIFIGLVAAQVNAGRFYSFLYWATIVATTTLGTTLADFADRSLGIGYPGGVAIVFTLLLASLVESIISPRAEWFYWCAILFSQTLGTALGDWVAGSDRGGLGLGYEYGAIIFGAALVIVAALYFWSKVSHTLVFWVAFILTRPLGATLGDLLDKPIAQGGLDLSRLYASLVLLAFIVVSILIIPQRPAKKNSAA